MANSEQIIVHDMITVVIANGVAGQKLAGLTVNSNNYC